MAAKSAMMSVLLFTTLLLQRRHTRAFTLSFFCLLARLDGAFAEAARC